MAVQVVAYEILRARGVQAERGGRASSRCADAPSDGAAVRASAKWCSRKSIFAIARSTGTNLMGRMRRIFQRAELDSNEVNILRGFLTAVQQRRRRAGEPVPPA